MKKVRLGSIGYVNSLPVDLGLLSGEVPSPCRLFRDVPSSLNRRLSEGDLDISPVSALHYAEHSDELLMLPGVSISSRSGVKSVLLLSRYSIDDLEGRNVAVTSQGKTTPALLKVILSGRYSSRAELETVPDAWSRLADGRSDAALVIGDDALRAAEQGAGGYKVYDLAQEWNAWTGLPFVFAVWAVRKDFAAGSAGLVQAANASIQESKRWGAVNMDRVLEESIRLTGLPERTLVHYFEHLCYDYDDDLKSGMSHFVKLAQEAGIVAEPIHTGENNARIVG